MITASNKDSYDSNIILLPVDIPLFYLKIDLSKVFHHQAPSPSISFLKPPMNAAHFATASFAVFGDSFR